MVPKQQRRTRLGATRGQMLGATSGQMLGAMRGQMLGATSGQMLGATRGQMLGHTKGQRLAIRSGDESINFDEVPEKRIHLEENDGEDVKTYLRRMTELTEKDPTDTGINRIEQDIIALGFDPNI